MHNGYSVRDSSDKEWCTVSGTHGQYHVAFNIYGLMFDISSVVNTQSERLLDKAIAKTMTQLEWYENSDDFQHRRAASMIVGNTNGNVIPSTISSSVVIALNCWRELQKSQ